MEKPLYTAKRKSLYCRQWCIQRVLDAGMPVWAPKLCAQIIEKHLKCFLIQTSEVKVFVAKT